MEGVVVYRRDGKLTFWIYSKETVVVPTILRTGNDPHAIITLIQQICDGPFAVTVCDLLRRQRRY